VGSIKADLDAFKGLKNPFKIKKIMNISENGEAILNEIEHKYEAINQKQKRILKVCFGLSHYLLGLYSNRCFIRVGKHSNNFS
jgi:hypothetical protein